MVNNVILFNKIFKGANNCTKRYRVLKGSAGSGKSVNIAQDYILKLMDNKYKGANLLVVRKVAESNRNSTFAELTAAIYKSCGDLALTYWEIKESSLELRCKVTGNKVIFCGFNDIRQREKVKSINFTEGKLTWIWIEEATELLENDVDILDDRLRGILPNDALYYQMTFTFNPVSSFHWIKAKYFDVNKPDIYTHHSTYLDNRFIDDGYHKRMMMRKERDPEGYKIYGLGEWGETGGLILNNWEVKEFNIGKENFDICFLGQDFGFNHYNAILDIKFKDGDIYLCKELYVNELDTSEIIMLADGMFDKKTYMWCDSAEPDRIKTWRKAGYSAVPVSKESGSVKAQIDYLKTKKIYVHPSCINTIKELQQWKWFKDPKTNEYTDEPVGVFDDAMAALRYGIEYIRKAKR